MREGWDVRPLGSLSDINYGYTESASFDAVGPRFLRITDIQNDRVDWNSVPYCPIAAEAIRKYRLATGDIVFARTGATTGKSFLVNDPPEAVFASYLIRLRLSGLKLLPKFLWLFFQTDSYWQSIKDGSTGSAQGGFNATKLAALSVPIPPVPEQKRIVAILDEAFEGIDTAVANAEKNLANARELLSKIHRKEFEALSTRFPIVTLGSICNFENGDRGKNYPGKEHRVALGIPFINAGHLTECGIDLASMDFISQERFDLLGNGKIKPKDILFCLRGSLGKFSSVEGLAAGAIASSLVILRPKASLSHDYLFEYLASNLCGAMIEKFKGGAAQPNLGAKDLGKFAIPLPLLAEQERVFRRLQQIRVETKRLEATYLSKILALNSLKQAILRKAFASELAVQSVEAVREAAE